MLFKKITKIYLIYKNTEKRHNELEEPGRTIYIEGGVIKGREADFSPMIQ